jgi:predicted NBD/HSP70 family sugar kinase
VLVGGQILRSPHDGFADAFGHIAVEAVGRRCECGRHGCLEARTRRAALLTAAGLGDGSMKDLMEHLHAGDVHAIAAVQDCGRWLGVGLATVVNLLAPPAIVLGGDFATLAPWIAPAVEEELRVRVFGSTPSWPSVAISHVGLDAAVRGAAATAVRRVDRLRPAV